MYYIRKKKQNEQQKRSGSIHDAIDSLRTGLVSRILKVN